MSLPDDQPAAGESPPPVPADVDEPSASADAPRSNTGDGPLEDAADAVADDIAELVDVTTQLAKERDEYLDSLRRLQADFENYKKRMQRQQGDLLERAGEGLASKLLPVLDTIDLAVQHDAGEGVEKIAAALLDVLTKEGLERIDPVGEAFDPNEHEAVAHEPGEGDGGEPVVSNLMRAGYRWKGRLVRAAMVTVRG
jgi:molecular chaperone GrpE